MATLLSILVAPFLNTGLYKIGLQSEMEMLSAKFVKEKQVRSPFRVQGVRSKTEQESSVAMFVKG